MFTGIVQHCVEVSSFETQDSVAVLSIKRPDITLDTTSIGQSYCIDGVCLTLVRFDTETMTFDLVKSTLDKTKHGQLQQGDFVNFEPSLAVGGVNGGHDLSGHVDCTATVKTVTPMDASMELTFKIPPNYSKYLFPQGFVAINGTSLTISAMNKDNHEFSVWIIPETANVTNIGKLAENDIVNIEVDKKTQVIVDTIRNTLKEFSMNN